LPPAPPAVQVLITQLDPAKRADYLAMGAALRKEGFRVANYLEFARLDKQLKYADKAGIPFVILFGANEEAKGTVLVKALAQNEQYEVPRDDLVARLRDFLMP
jgi:histidyl-tRNA synthetase